MSICAYATFEYNNLKSLVIHNSSVAKLEYTGAHTIATRGCAPPVQACLKVIGGKCNVVNRGGLLSCPDRIYITQYRDNYLYLQNNEVLYDLNV